jgi:hypothetical protein
MKCLAIRSFALLLLFVVQLASAGCAEDRPPPTREEVIHACGILNLETCRAFGRCLGWTPARTQQCVDEENAGCDDELQDDTCWEAQRDALEACSAEVAADSCSEVCNNGFCGNRCLYFCPTP